MSHDTQGDDHDRPEEPTTEELQEPSIAKEPDEVPKAPEPHDPEPDHEAIGIGTDNPPGPDGAA